MERGLDGGTLGRVVRVGAMAVLSLALVHCSSSDKFARQVDPRYGVASSPRVVGPGEPVPKGGGTYRVGKPYMVAGRIYSPEEDINYRAEGLASWYGPDFHGRLTANGEVFDMHSMSAAHPTLPMPCYVRVTNLFNGRSVIVRVNDRGPYHDNRLIDVSIKAADLLGFSGHGVARVRVEYVGRAPLEGSDDGLLMATLRRGEPAPPPSSGIMMAAAKPFLPLLKEGAGMVRGAIPVPPDRPYTLGEAQSGPAPRPGSDRTSMTRVRQVDTAGLTLPTPSEAPPRTAAAISAFAPIRSDISVGSDMPHAIMTGRGLY